jgi:hypothetical protein
VHPDSGVAPADNEVIPIRSKTRIAVWAAWIGLGYLFEFCHSALRDDEAIQLDRRGALRAPRDDNHFEETR